MHVVDRGVHRSASCCKVVVLPAGAQDMAFNNLPCTLVGMSAMGSEGSAAAEVKASMCRKWCGPAITGRQHAVRGWSQCNVVKHSLFHICCV